MYDAEGNDYMPPEDVTAFENLIFRTPMALWVPIVQNHLRENAKHLGSSELGVLHVELMCNALDTLTKLSLSHNDLRRMLRTPGPNSLYK